jgi:hypothetical protein
MLFIIDNPNHFQAGVEIYGLHTRSKNQLFVPIAKLSSVKKRITILVLKFSGRVMALWLRHYTTNRQVAGSIPDGVIGIFQ